MQKLVNETFQKIWFTPTPSHDKDAMTRKILNITDVVRTTFSTQSFKSETLYIVII